MFFRSHLVHVFFFFFFFFVKRQKYSKASDVYAFGVLIGELFERSPPMLGLDAIDAAHAIVDNARIPLHPPPPPGTQQLISWWYDQSFLSYFLNKIESKCVFPEIKTSWQMEPDGRPRMHDIIAALKKLPLEDFRVPEEPPSKAERKERGERNKEANKARIAREDAELAAKQHAAQSNVPKPARAVPQIQLPDEAETNEETGRSGSGRRSPRQRLGAWLRGLAHEPQHDVDQAMPGNCFVYHSDNENCQSSRRRVGRIALAAARRKRAKSLVWLFAARHARQRRRRRTRRAADCRAGHCHALGASGAVHTGAVQVARQCAARRRQAAAPGACVAALAVGGFRRHQSPAKISPGGQNKRW